MVTYEEAQKALQEAVAASPDDFLKIAANLIPQGLIEKLWEEMDRYWEENTEIPEMDAPTVANVAYSMGLQVGFLFGQAVRK